MQHKAKLLSTSRNTLPQFATEVEKRATTLLKLQCSNVGRQDERKYRPFYVTCKKISHDLNFGQKNCQKITPSQIFKRNIYSTVQNFEVQFLAFFMLETLLDIRNGLIHFTLFCRWCFLKILIVQ